MRTRRRSTATRAHRAAIACLVALAGCGEYAATNPYDSRVATTLSLAGPDTTSHIGQELTFSLVASPPWPGAKPLWSSSDTALVSLGGGRFSVHSASYYDRFATVTATLGSRSVSHQVRVRQRTARILLTGVSPYSLRDSTFATTWGAPMPFGAQMMDEGGNPIGSPWPNGPHVLKLLVRDTTVASFTTDGALHAGVTGRSYLVAEADGRRDSMVVRVRQLPSSASSSPSPVYLNPGDSAQVTIVSWRDASDHAIPERLVILGYNSVSAFVGTAPVSTVTADGWVHADTLQSIKSIDNLLVHWATADGLFSGWVNAGTIWVGMTSYP